MKAKTQTHDWIGGTDRTDIHGSWRDVYVALACPLPDDDDVGQGGERRS